MPLVKTLSAIVADHGDFEIRRYAPMILAETRVDSDFEKAGNEAFRRLFGYISGDNAARAKIEMTAPVALSGK
ncbi:MAG: heme-binding protein [Thermoanaerobaculales bacterium]|nr:heme-binding protein [Thermoanaerobaculales bacterium]